MKAEPTTGKLLKRVRHDEPSVEQIYDTLLAAIRSLELRPGERVSEADIAKAVGASRTPVRAALARLSEDGLIATWPSRGNYVTRISAEAVRGAHFIRDALESRTVALLARHGLSAEADAALSGNLTKAADAAEQGDADAFSRLDDEFHRQLARATGHVRLVHVHERETAGLARLRALCPEETPYMRMIVEEHRGIVRAICAGDVELAQSRLSAHIGRALHILEKLQHQHHDYLEE